MTIIAVAGDAATTTTVALAAGWPDGDVLVLEADASGGSLAGWLDTPAHPSLATIVANAGADAGDHRAVMASVDAMTLRSAAGIRFVANAVRARAAHRAVDEAAHAVLPALAAAPAVVLADAGRGHSGRGHAGPAISPALRAASVIALVHRQATASAAAATVRVERLVEAVEELAHLQAIIVLAVIGRSPFDPAEIGAFVDESVPATIHTTVSLADDPLAATTLAGRTGVSAARLRRLPLMRDTANLALLLRDLSAARGAHPDVGTPVSIASGDAT